MKNKLLVATHNKGKVKEFAEMLADLQVNWLGLDEAGVVRDVEETGTTFRENALLKAQAYAVETGLLTLADDSGLVVDALDGQPGVYTGRYGGPGLSYAERYTLLLHKLRAVPWARRTARFCCVILLAGPDGTVLEEAEGVCEGYIAFEPAGSGGFGYDPVFYVAEKGVTMASLDSAVKHTLSHRGRAMKAIEPRLRDMLHGRGLQAAGWQGKS